MSLDFTFNVTAGVLTLGGTYVGPESPLYDYDWGWTISKCLSDGTPVTVGGYPKIIGGKNPSTLAIGYNYLIYYNVNLVLNLSTGRQLVIERRLSPTGASTITPCFTLSPQPPIRDSSITATDTSFGSPSVAGWTWSPTYATSTWTDTFSHTGLGVTLLIYSSSGKSGTTYLGSYADNFGIEANFTHTPDPQVTGSNVAFTDTSVYTGINAWFWDFDDGNTSTSPNPFHIYSSPGTYTVQLISSYTTRAATSDPVTHDVTIIAALVASFIVDPKGLDPAAPQITGQAINFIDTSTGSPSTWSWDFGDGGTSSSQNPTHTYVASETYTVTLTVT